MPTAALHEAARSMILLEIELARVLQPDDHYLECTKCNRIYRQSEASEYLGMSGIVGCPGCGNDEAWDLTEGEVDD
jgi:hypothetical protein